MKLVTLVFALSALIPAGTSAEPIQKPFKVALLCLATGEQVSGLNKICFYNCAGSEAAITVKAYQLCPININR